MKVTIQQKLAMAALGSATLLFLACGSGTVTDPDSDASAEVSRMLLGTTLENATIIDSMMTECASGNVKCTEGGDTKVPSSSSTDASSAATAASSSGAATPSSSSTAVVASSSSTATTTSSSSVKTSSSSSATVTSSSSATVVSSSSAAVSSSSGAANSIAFKYDSGSKSLESGITYNVTFSAPNYNPAIPQGQLVCTGSGDLTLTTSDTTFTKALPLQANLPSSALSCTIQTTGAATCEQKW